MTQYCIAACLAPPFLNISPDLNFLQVRFIRIVLKTKVIATLYSSMVLSVKFVLTLFETKPIQAWNEKKY